MKTRNLLLVLFLVVIALASYVYFFVYHKSHQDIYKARPEVTIEALDLYRAFAEDEASANENYLGKVIKVEGTVLEIEMEGEILSAIRLDVGEMLDAVVCEMDRVYVRETKIPEVGDRIALQGLCTGFLNDVILNRCAIK